MHLSISDFLGVGRKRKHQNWARCSNNVKGQVKGKRESPNILFFPETKRTATFCLYLYLLSVSYPVFRFPVLKPNEKKRRESITLFHSFFFVLHVHLYCMFYTFLFLNCGCLFIKLFLLSTLFFLLLIRYEFTTPTAKTHDSAIRTHWCSFHLTWRCSCGETHHPAFSVVLCFVCSCTCCQPTKVYRLFA